MYSKFKVTKIFCMANDFYMELVLMVEKMTLANPPSDDSDIGYKLIEIITEHGN